MKDIYGLGNDDSEVRCLPYENFCAPFGYIILHFKVSPGFVRPCKRDMNALPFWRDFLPIPCS